MLSSNANAIIKTTHNRKTKRIQPMVFLMVASQLDITSYLYDTTDVKLNPSKFKLIHYLLLYNKKAPDFLGRGLL